MVSILATPHTRMHPGTYQGKLCAVARVVTMKSLDTRVVVQLRSTAENFNSFLLFDLVVVVRCLRITVSRQRADVQLPLTPEHLQALVATQVSNVCLD